MKTEAAVAAAKEEVEEAKAAVKTAETNMEGAVAAVDESAETKTALISETDEKVKESVQSKVRRRCRLNTSGTTT